MSKESDKKYYQKNKERLKQLALERYKNNSEHYKQLFKNRYENETVEQKQKRKNSTINYINNNKAIINAKQIDYYYKNKEKILNRQIKYSHNKYKTDPVFRLRIVLSATINQRLKKVNTKKSKSSLEIVGLENWKLLKEHIESQWIEGMSWENYGNTKESWSIDHIIPLSSANNEEEIIKLNHYTNLRPMWHVENIKKSNKII